MDELLISVDEAARRLAIGHSKVWELVGSGEIPSIRIGRRRLIRPTALEEWVSRQAGQQS